MTQFDPLDPKVHDYSKIFIIVQKNNNKKNNKVTLRTLEVNSRGQKWLENHDIYTIEAGEMATLRTSPRMEIPLIKATG